ncbi:hypothetical protein BHM03_00043002 [Ensete ventricosum]|nr:hypothetical protein BHM03_00043002 [Ensete ventricosum]
MFYDMIQLAIVTKNYVGLTSEMRRRTSTSLLKKNLSLRLPLDPLCRTKMKLEASLICVISLKASRSLMILRFKCVLHIEVSYCLLADSAVENHQTEEKEEQRANAEDVQRQQPVKRKARRKPSRRIMDDKHLMIPGNIYQLWLQDTSDIVIKIAIAHFTSTGNILAASDMTYYMLMNRHLKLHFDTPGAPQSESLNQLAFGMNKRKAAQLFYQTCAVYLYSLLPFLNLQFLSLVTSSRSNSMRHMVTYQSQEGPRCSTADPSSRMGAAHFSLGKKR